MSDVESDLEFETLGLRSNIIRGCEASGFTRPYTIHEDTIPLILSGQDVILVAPSCSARALTFLAPLLDRLNQNKALILTPTKDFALDIMKLVPSTCSIYRWYQVHMPFINLLNVFPNLLGLGIGLLVGDNDMESLFEELTVQDPDVLIATPDGLVNHLSHFKYMSLHNVDCIVFDEADYLLSLGIEKHLRQILSHINESHQTLLFANTLPTALVKFVKSVSQHPQMVRHCDTITSILKHVFFTLSREEKTAVLLYLIKERIRSNERTLIFVPTRDYAEFLNLLFMEQGINPSVCYGDMGREAWFQVSRFRRGENRLLITTDMASNGMGSLAVDNVINWDFPCSPEHFLSRVRATTGAVQPGTVFFFVTRPDIPHVLDFRIFLLKEMVTAAPTEEQIAQHGNKLEVVSEVDLANEKRKIFYGSLPEIVVDSYDDEVQKMLDASPKLKSMRRSWC